MALTEKQRAHARRNALQDAPGHAHTAEVMRANGKPCTWNAERIARHTEYVASLIAPKREPARTEWKDAYRYYFTAYMVNTKTMEPEPEPPAPKVQVTKDGPAYLLPGIEPASKQEGDTEQLAMF